MNFFAHQDEARKLTRRLVLYFIFAVFLITLTLALLIATILDITIYEQQFNAGGHENYFKYLISQHGRTLLWVSSGTILLIIGISLFRSLTLRQGGHVVANWVGAREINYDTRDSGEKRLLNIVDEISIASGISRPGVYIMDDETGINAFAAGYNTNNAVVAVTRGTLEQLNRDELQGVVAHEFSHILNGDMRLNIRLMGVLAGILFIGNIGLFMVRSLAYTRRRSRDNQGTFAIIAIGITLTVIGFIGVFFGRIIRAAVSRQREYLADASAVQFTRNPNGIAAALNKIRLVSAGSKIENSHAEEMSHMYFGEAVELHFLSGLLASHPPLPDRIIRIKPDFDLHAQLSTVNLSPSPVNTGTNKQTTNLASVASLANVVDTPENLLASTGTLTDRHIEYGQKIHNGFDPILLTQLETESGLRALLYTLMLSNQSGYRMRQIALINNQGETVVAQKVRQLYPLVAGLEITSRLPLFELILPELRRRLYQSVSQNTIKKNSSYNSPLFDAAAKAILSTLEKIITIDKHISIKEFIYLLAADSILNPKAYRALRVKYRSLDQISSQIILLIALMAITGHQQADNQKQAYYTGIKASRIDAASDITLSAFSYNQCRTAMHEANKLTPAAKELLMLSLAETALSDQTVTIEEFDLLRALAMALNCPVPPIVTDTIATNTENNNIESKVPN